MAGTTGLEPATSAVTGQRSNQLSYVPKYVVRLGKILHRINRLAALAISLDSTRSPFSTRFGKVWTPNWTPISSSNDRIKSNR